LSKQVILTGEKSGSPEPQIEGRANQAQSRS